MEEEEAKGGDEEVARMADYVSELIGRWAADNIDS